MPSAPGVSAEEAKKIKDAQDKKKKAEKAKKEARAAYLAQAKTDTVEELIGAGELEKTWFKEGDWKPAWGNVEFVSGPERL